MILFVVGAITVIGAGIYLFLQQPRFGRLPMGEYKQQLEKSPQYVQGSFQNITPTPVLTDNSNIVVSLAKFVLAKRERPMPKQAVPAVKENLAALSRYEDSVTWLGHSSYFLQVQGQRVLIDPVLSSYASPLAFINRPFAGASPYEVSDFPPIDYVLISHDHWDHLDYSTMVALKDKVRYVICPLGVGGYLRQWGFAPGQIYEGDWFDSFTLDADFTVHILPAQHFSGRLLQRNKTLWAGFAVITPKQKIYYSGDGGYGEHFKEIGQRLGPFDLALMENGQYGERWPYIHMKPEEAAQAAVDIGARKLLPGHTAKFALANHPWDEPYVRMDTASLNKPYQLLTPLIGETVILDKIKLPFKRWWEDIQ